MLTEADVRRRRVGGAAAIVVGIALLVLAGLAITGKLGAITAAKPPESAGATSSGAPGSGEASESANTTAPLIVLNASAAGGLAGKGKTAFEANGWKVTQTGNLTGDDVPKASTVYYPADDEEAHVAAQSLVKQFPKLVAQKAPDGFAYQGVVVVLTGDWTPGE